MLLMRRGWSVVVQAAAKPIWRSITEEVICIHSNKVCAASRR